MMDGMHDEKQLKLESLMQLIKELKGMEGEDLPGNPKVSKVEIEAVKMPGEPMEADMEPSMPNEEHSEELSDESDEMDIPPALLAMLKDKLSKKI